MKKTQAGLWSAVLDRVDLRASFEVFWEKTQNNLYMGTFRQLLITILYYSECCNSHFQPLHSHWRKLFFSKQSKSISLTPEDFVLVCSLPKESNYTLYSLNIWRPILSCILLIFFSLSGSCPTLKCVLHLKFCFSYACFELFFYHLSLRKCFYYSLEL